MPQALGGWRPTLGVDSGVAYNDVDSSVGGDTFTSTSNSLTVDQELYSGGETVANTERAERLVRLERARLQAIEQDVLLDAVTVYTNLLAAQAVLDFAIQNETRLTRQPQATRTVSRWVRSRGPTSRRRGRLSGATADRVQAEGALSIAESDYRRVINQEPGTLVASAARRAPRQRAGSSAAERGRQPEHCRGAVRSGRGSVRGRRRALGPPAAPFG